MTDELTPRLRARAKAWAGQITKLAHRNLGKFRKIISVKSTVKESAGKVDILSTATGEASRAYEYGSGIHSRLSKKSPKQISPKGKILIKPITRKVLAFNWEVANTSPGYFIFLDDGRVIFPSVKHPGVKAANEGKGYLAPAVNEVRKQIRKEISKETRDAVLGTFRKSFKK
jgi:hypothetical protein